MKFEIIKTPGSWLLAPGYWFTVLFLLLASCTSTQVRDGMTINTIPAEIREDLTVSGTIIVRGEVKVFPGATLTVKPGTSFLFEPFDPDGDGVNDSRLAIEGRFVARGEPDAPITFGSAAAEPQPGDWLELRIDRSEGIILEYIVLQHSRYGLHVHFSSGVVANSIFRNNIDGTRFGTSHILFLGNRVVENISKGFNMRDSKIWVTANSFINNRHGIFIFERGVRSIITHNRFSGNSSSDVRFGDFYEGDFPHLEFNEGSNGEQLNIPGMQELADDPSGTPAVKVDGLVNSPSNTICKQRTSWGGDHADGMGRIHFAPSTKLPSTALRTGGMVSLSNHWQGKEAIPRLVKQLEEPFCEVVIIGPQVDSWKVTPLWEHEIGSFVDGGPVPLNGDRVAVASWNEGISILDMEDGKLLARVPVGDYVDATPHFDGAALFLPVWNRTFVKINPDSGSIVKKKEWSPSLSDDHRQASPVQVDERIIQGLWNGELWALNPGSLEKLWSLQLDGPIRATPVVQTGKFWVVTETGIAYLVSGKGTIMQKLSLGEAVWASPADLGNGLLAVVTKSGILKVFDRDGPVWSRKLSGPGTYSPPVAMKNSNFATVAVADGRGAVFLFDSDGALLWRTEIGSAVHTLSRKGPALWAGTEDGTLAALDYFTGRILSRLKANGAIHGRPAWADNGDQIIWAARDGIVRALELNALQRQWEGPTP